MTKIIGVLVAMDTDANLSDEHCGQRLRSLLQPQIKDQGHDWQFAFYQAHKGELPENVTDCDAYAVTGSPNSVNDDDPWIEPLLDFIREIDTHKIPTIGICFGHQAIAKALGGEVINAGKGWRLGITKTHYRTQKPWMNPDFDSLQIPAAHHDQVIALPERAEVLGGNDYCPITSIGVDDHFFTTAYHPEMTVGFLADMVHHLDKKESAKLGDKAYREALDDLQHVTPQSDAFPSKLLDGYRGFKSNRFEQEKERYETLAAEGQQPETLMIACCDSRAAPETIFNASPGELFVTRNVANIVPPYSPDGTYRATAAALEYAVQVLKVKKMEEPLSPGDFIGKWMELLTPAAENVSQNDWMTDVERQTALERINIRNSVANLRTFPCVSMLEGRGKVEVHGAWFDISKGELWVMDYESGDFVRAPEEVEDVVAISC